MAQNLYQASQHVHNLLKPLISSFSSSTSLPLLFDSINVFQGKIQTVQFTNIYKHILFLHDIHMILVIMKTN